MKKLIWMILAYLLIPLSLFAGGTKVLFSPNGECQQAIVDEINAASSRIDIAMYNLTSREIAQALIAAKERGVAIRIFLDQEEANSKYSKGRYLAQNGLSIRCYQGEGLMHNKFAVIDNRVLITGSFNWTPTAERKNQENLLIMTDKDLIKQFSNRFELLWRSGR